MLVVVVFDQGAGPAVGLGVDLGGEERGAIADPARLLHVVRDDHDGEAGSSSSRISSSMRAVAMGSSALHGSSISTTSGPTAMVRAMHSRCCCPPDRPSAEALQAVLDLVPQRRAPQRLLDDGVELGLGANAVDSRAEGDVVVDALGERVRLLEHHADAAADLGGRHVGGVQVGGVVAQPARHPRPRGHVVHPVEAAQDRGLSAARGADERRDLVLEDLHGHAAHGAEAAVVDLELLEVEHDRAVRSELASTGRSTLGRGVAG